MASSEVNSVIYSSPGSDFDCIDVFEIEITCLSRKLVKFFQFSKSQLYINDKIRSICIWGNCCLKVEIFI